MPLPREPFRHPIATVVSREILRFEKTGFSEEHHVVGEDVGRVVLDLELIPTLVERGVGLNLFEDSPSEIKVAFQKSRFSVPNEVLSNGSRLSCGALKKE